jgi:hypothetical protein
MDLEAFRKRGYSAFDVTPGPHADDSVEPKSFRHVYALDARMGMHAPQDRRMEHVRQANVGNVHTAAVNEATGFVRFEAAADISG